MVAPLVASTPKTRGLNPVMGKTLSINCAIKNRKDENKENEAGNGPSFKKNENATKVHLC